MANKILLIGRAATGKTSIKKIIFEGSDPIDLMLHALPPTHGLETSVYSWLDLELGIFDAAGQELNSFLDNEEEQKKAFGNTSAILYVLDYPSWSEQSIEIVKEIEKIFNIVKEKSYSGKFTIIFHKVDLINQKLIGTFDNLKREIRQQLKLLGNIPLYFTSIYPELIYNTYNAFFDILSGMSKETADLKKIMDKYVNNFPKTIIFITNSFNSIVVQTMTEDFTLDIVNQLQKYIAKLGEQSEENLAALYGEVKLIDSGPMVVSMIMDSLEGVSSNLKNLICISEIHKIDKLIELMSNIKADITDFYEKK